MDKDKLKKYLKEKGFEDINEDDVFDSDYATVYIDAPDEPGISISYGHSEHGWYSIKNPTWDQIVTIVELFSASTFSETTTPNIIKSYGKLILTDFEKYLSKNQEDN